MSLKRNLYAVTAIALVGLFQACNASKPGTSGAGIAAPTAESLVAAAAATPISGPVSYAGFTKQDGSAMTQAELDAAIAKFPGLGVNHNQIKAAARADVALSGTVTLWDSAGKVIIVIPAGGYQTIRSVQVSSGATKEQGQCAGNTLVFDLSDSCDLPAEQGQEQGKDKEESKEVQSTGFHDLLVMACEETKQEEPKEEPKQEEPKQEEPKQVPTPSPTQQK